MPQDNGISLDFEKRFEEQQDVKGRLFRTLHVMYRGHYMKLFVSFIFFLLKHSPVWILPIVTANLINFAANPGEQDVRTLWINIIVLTVVIIQNLPSQILHISFMSKAIRHVEASLRSTLIRKLQHLSISYHGELRSGKLQAKVLRDVEMIEIMSKQTMLGVLPALMNVIVAIAVTANRSWSVTSFFLVAIPISIVIVYFFRGKLNRRNREFREQVEEMSGQVAETVEMIPVTRAHGLEKVEINKMDSLLHHVRGKGYKLDITEAFFGASNWVAFQLFQVLCLLFTVYLAYQGSIPIGDVVLYQTYFTQILMSISGVINIYPQLAKGFESVHSISEILFAKETQEYQGKMKLKQLDGSVEFENVYFKYRDTDKHVLESFCLSVKPGETVAFVGESGAGKSTILNLVTGFYRPTSGRILIDEIPMDDVSMRSFRKNIAVVPQNTILFSGSIRDNITYGLAEVNDQEVEASVKMANLQDIIKELPEGLDTKIGEHGDRLSGGQRQRIAIARAFIRNPQMVILDEATSALDNISEKLIQDAMQELVKGKTTFIVAHRLSTIRDADRIVVMNNGQCVETGTYDQLLANRGEFYQIKMASEAVQHG
ncbi:ABC transporter ATP-binding protein/permease [Gracilibacillus caseinilyticus]|uniref:ABC transporter ATP-binding protein/permease n=1 Tax=Gracilibacillus caseinilyticus TaxID=2932256 RepID=A0ABY4EVN4_9BACI|nr:ABC transporter ATP-binding protein [Gracilibacillus caseinilyticus]UOQ48460.1 ABC transporter ATP-binding protein/permease [Gracilibacillus caseinilyticus]